MASPLLAQRMMIIASSATDSVPPLSPSSSASSSSPSPSCLDSPLSSLPPTPDTSIPRSFNSDCQSSIPIVVIVNSDHDNVVDNHLQQHQFLDSSSTKSFILHKSDGVDSAHSHQKHHALPRAAPSLALHPIITRKKVESSPDGLTKSPLRPLIFPLPMAATSTAAAAGTRDLPGSPPDLTDSKSSKSSSFHSSSLADNSSCDLSHFEDISLDEVRRSNSGEFNHGGSGVQASTWSSRNLTARPKPSPAFYAFTGPQSVSSRDLTAGKPLGYVGSRPTSSSGPKGRYQLPVPGPRTSRLSPQVRSTPFLQPGPPSFRSRSPSPAASPSSHSIRTNTSSTFSAPTSSITPKRRQSWQPGRKTVKELEDEYHDSDEEIPDDAVVWNIPISPRDAHQRDFKRSQTDPTPLPFSPEFNASLLKSDAKFAFRSTSNFSSIDESISKSLPNSPVPASPVSSASSTEFPGSLSQKSRAAALSDLSLEARHLTDVLEIFADQSERSLEARIQTGKFKHVKGFSVDMCVGISKHLPPLRKNDPLIDPLPPSKQKEQFLTRTRPSWLPPKNPREEKRHLKEYQKMMALAVEAEKKRAKKQHKLQAEKDAAASDRKALWENHILPHWDQAVTEPQTKELWWHGVPGHRRGEVWSKAVGNELNLTQASFDAALTRAKEAEQRLSSLTDEEREVDVLGYTFAKFKRVADNLHVELNLFQRGMPLYEPLLDVTMAYAVYRPDVGSDIRVAYLASLILLNLPTSAAFITLANILHRPLPAALLSGNDPATTTLSTSLVLATLRYHLGNLSAHLDSTIQGRSVHHADRLDIHDSQVIARPISPASFSSDEEEMTLESLIIPILRAVTSCSPHVGIETSARIWDVVVFEGDSALIRAAVAVLARLESRLYGDRVEILKELSVDDEEGKAEKWLLGDSDEFMEQMKEMGRVDGE